MHIKEHKSLACLGYSFSGVVKARAAQEHVKLLPGLATCLLHVKKALDLWAAAGIQEILYGGGEQETIERLIIYLFSTQKTPSSYVLHTNCHASCLTYM